MGALMTAAGVNGDGDGVPGAVKERRRSGGTPQGSAGDVEDGTSTVAGGSGTGSIDDDDKEELSSRTDGADANVLDLAGLDNCVRAFVLSNDPVPRMWLAADPLFGAAVANETVVNVLNAREWLFGPGIVTKKRFLYEAAGTLCWLDWSASDGASLSVHVGSENVLNRLTFGSGRGRDDDVFATRAMDAARGALDHNMQSYLDAVQYVAMKRLNGLDAEGGGRMSPR